MGQLIDISGKITNELPCVKITDEIVVTINNRRTNILNIQCMVEEVDRKNEENGDSFNEMTFMNKALELLIGAGKTREINELDLPFPEYKEVYNTIFNVATGQHEETPS